MGWRVPVYHILHAARDAGAAAITGNNAFHADFPKDFLIDDRAGSLCKFNASAADHYIQIDRGAAGLTAIDRIFIPSGHNIAGNNITLDADDNAGFTSPTSLLGTIPVPAGLFEQSFASNTEQYIRLNFSYTGTPELPELILSQTRTPSIGPEPGWTDQIVHNTLDFTKESGSIASLALGADRREIEYVYRDVNVAADLTIFSDLIDTVGTSRPFWLNPTFDTEDPIWMKLQDDSRQSQERAFPAGTTSARPRIVLSMLEHLA